MPARIFAEPTSHGFGITNTPGPSCKARNRSAFSLWVKLTTHLFLLRHRRTILPNQSEALLRLSWLTPLSSRCSLIRTGAHPPLFASKLLHETRHVILRPPAVPASGFHWCAVQRPALLQPSGDARRRLDRFPRVHFTHPVASSGVHRIDQSTLL